MTRPRGRPPTPSAMSSPSEPVETAWMSRATSWSPRRITEPLPNCFSIWLSAAASALFLSSANAGVAMFLSPGFVNGGQPVMRLHGGNVGDRFIDVNKKYHLHIKYNMLDCIQGRSPYNLQNTLKRRSDDYKGKNAPRPEVVDAPAVAVHRGQGLVQRAGDAQRRRPRLRAVRPGGDQGPQALRRSRSRQPRLPPRRVWFRAC